MPKRSRKFQEATYDNPRDADGYYNIAATYHRMGREEHCESDLKQAEKFYNDCLDRNPNHTECYRGLAVLLAEQNRKDAAFRLLQGWVDREPMSADAKVELARLYEESGNRLAAKDCLVEALEAQPDHARALTALGKIREEAGDKAQALANYQRSLSRDSRQPYVASRINAPARRRLARFERFERRRWRRRPRAAKRRDGHSHGRPRPAAAEVGHYFRLMSWFTLPELMVTLCPDFCGSSNSGGSGNHPSTAISAVPAPFSPG